MKKISPEDVAEVADLSGEVRVLPSANESSGGSARVGALVGGLVGGLVLLPVLYVGVFPAVIVALDEKNLLPNAGLVFDLLSGMAIPLAWLYDHFTPFQDYIDWLSKLF